MISTVLIFFTVFLIRSFISKIFICSPNQISILFIARSENSPGVIILLYSSILYCTLLFYIVLYSMLLYCTALSSSVLYCTLLFYICTALYSSVLYCTLLYSRRTWREKAHYHWHPTPSLSYF